MYQYRQFENKMEGQMAQLYAHVLEREVNFDKLKSKNDKLCYKRKMNNPQNYELQTSSLELHEMFWMNTAINSHHL